MDSRFTFKDFVFVVLFIVVIAAMGWTGWRFSYQEERLNDLQKQLGKLDSTQNSQLLVLQDIRKALLSGVSVTPTTGGGNNSTNPETAHPGRIRQVSPDGSQYVYYPDVPLSPRDPTKLPDYSFGDWLVQNIGQEPKSLAPYITADMAGTIAQGAVFESLVSQNPENMNWEPYVADKFWISADGLTFRFHIRPQAAFSDGEKLTADDVVFSFNTIMNPDIDCEQLRGYYERVKTCTKIDAQTVEFKMQEPYFLAMDFIGGLQIIPEHLYKFTKADDFNKNLDHLVGSGQYVLEKWDKGSKVVLARNEKYWGDRPTFDKLVFLFIGNSQTQMESLLKGDVDFLSEPIEPEPEQFLKYSQDPDFSRRFQSFKFSRANAMYMYIGYNERNPIFKDKETRQALTMLIDRKNIIDEFQKGFGTEMAGPFNSMRKQCDPTIKILPFDPDAARKKLADAGWKPGPNGILMRDGVEFKFDLMFRAGVPIRERIASRVKQWLKQANIDMNLVPMEASVMFDRMDTHKFDATLAGWGSGGVEEDPNQIWSSKSIDNKGSNHISFSNPEVDKLIDEGRRTLDDAKRMEIWHKFQRIVYEEQPYTWLYSEEDCAFVDGRFKNTQPYPTGLSPGDWYVPMAQQKYKL